MEPERRAEDDVGAKKMNERLHWAVKMTKELADKEHFAFDKEVFIKALEIGISMFIQSEKR